MAWAKHRQPSPGSAELHVVTVALLIAAPGVVIHGTMLADDPALIDLFTSRAQRPAQSRRGIPPTR